MLSLGVSNGLGVAVTGQLEKDGAKAIIVVSKNSYHSSGQEPFHIEPTSVTATKFEPKDIQYLTKCVYMTIAHPETLSLCSETMISLCHSYSMFKTLLASLS